MTLKEYMQKPHPISDETLGNGQFEVYNVIKMGNSRNRLDILVAHIGKQSYALGYVIKDGGKPSRTLMPSIFMTAMGDIKMLLYGLVKMLENKLEGKCSGEMRKVLSETLEELNINANDTNS